MDPGTVVRDDLRSYALRRCIRFYTALVLVAFAMVGSQVVEGVSSKEIFIGIGLLLVVLAAVEVAGGIVMAQMAKVRAQHPGPETPLWAFAQGPAPSWLAAGLFVASAGFLFWGASI